MEEIFRRAGITPRPGQLEAAETLASLLEESSRVAFVAPPGFGKTLVVLAVLKSRRLFPATWRVRALALARRIADDAAVLDIGSELLLGRERVCPYAPRMGEDVHEWCRMYKVKCPFFRARTCPYYFHSMDRDLYIMNYRRRAPPRVIDVWDEAHNLLAPRERCVGEEQIVEAAGEAGEEELARRLEELAGLLETPGPVDVEPELVARVYRAYVRVLSGERPTALGRLYRVLAAQALSVEDGRLCGYEVLLPRRGLLVSATLPHAEAFGPVLEIPWTRKLRAAVVPYLTSRYEEFDEDMARRARAFLLKLKKAYKRILVFATQRVAKKIAPAADLYEPESIPRDWTGALLLHARGRFSEGVDIRGVDAVVVLGAPYLPPHASERLRRALKAQGFQGDITEIAMLSTVLQCVGRATRSPEDNPLVILADHRFKRHEGELSKYFEFVELQQL
jgi:DNA excision repair protein ERCC-2